MLAMTPLHGGAANGLKSRRDPPLLFVVARQCFSNAIPYTGGGIASNEYTLELPLQSNEMQSFLPLLNFFAYIYTINLVGAFI